MGLKRVLNAGCGSKANQLAKEWFDYLETRLDVNPLVEPDILSSIVAMPMVKDESYDAVFCSHCLEHLYACEVSLALAEFRRVLKPGGKVVIQVPDLQAIGGAVAMDRLDQALYQSAAAGIVTPLDMIYGLQSAIGAGNLFMQHKTGFTQGVLKRRLEVAGLGKVEIDREIKFELKATAYKAVESTLDGEAPPPRIM